MTATPLEQLADLLAHPPAMGAEAETNGHADLPDEDGWAVLDDVRAALARYVVFPTPETADAVTLFVAATHAQSAWEHASRLVIKSPVKRCGKTRLQDVCAELVHQPLRTTNISVAALVRSIDPKDPPTVMLDEADSVFATRRGERSEGAEDLRGILNSGHSPGWPYIRWNVSTRSREECPTFAMAMLGGIGDLPDTIEDRAVIVSLRRRAPGEVVAPFRRRRCVPPLQLLGARLHAWGRRHLHQLADLEPDLPVEDRAADVWEPLVAVADLAGGAWPVRARTACKKLTGIIDPEDATVGERLLGDVRDVFGGSELLATKELLDRLHAVEEAPWGDWFGKPLTAATLGRLLRPYGVRSHNVRPADQPQAKGYERDDFADAWRRYLGTPPVPGVPPSQGDRPADEGRDGSGTDSDSATRPSHDQHQVALWDGGTPGTHGVREDGSQ